MAAEPVPRREVVTRHPGSTPAHTAYRSTPYRPATEPPRALTPAAHAHVRRLIRRQLRAGLATGAALALLVGTLPLVFRYLPGTGLGPVPAVVVWLVLGVAVYPLLLLLAGRYVRRAERNERDYTRAVEGA
ncbi:hypothetical protein [Streptomyces roseicoloratus]|uniref:Integral membrane protein n=1 Tax=Streptomyces roseicoloratus TaxID=2508722 RepID=A0ABY9S1K4_9ACTN|nr:hypothetical protein [Streptomyces roseicoloratus]WMX48303.1 hypothetical protein RGF97_30790 [Streptomyces roseicoloratus]